MMFVNGGRLLKIVKEDGRPEDFIDRETYESDCFNVAKLILYLLASDSLGSYLSSNEEGSDDLEIKNQIKRACNLYGIKI